MCSVWGWFGVTWCLDLILGIGSRIMCVVLFFVCIVYMCLYMYVIFLFLYVYLDVFCL